MQLRTTLKIVLVSLMFFAVSYFCATVGGLHSIGAVAAQYSTVLSKPQEINLIRKFSAADVDAIDMALISSDILVEKSDTAEIVVTLTGSFPIKDKDKESALVSKLANRKLTLAVDNASDEEFPRVGFHIGTAGKVKLAIPTSMKKLEVKSISGDMDFKSLNLDSLKTETVSGDILGENSQIVRLDVETTSGELQWKGLLSELKSKTVSGEVELSLRNSDPKIYCKTVSSNIKIAFDSNPNLKFDFSTTSGDYEIHPSAGRVTKGTDSYSAQLGNGLGEIRAETVSGDFKILKK
jgi:hypothetical protein